MNERLGRVLRLIRGHFTLMRPVQLLWFDIFIGFSSYVVLADRLPKAHFLLFILTSLLADAGACTINDYGDVRSDSISTEGSRKFRPLCTGLVNKKAAKVQAFVFFGLSLALAFALDIYLFLFALALVILSHQYSLGPLKMNGRPFVSQLFWVLFAVLYYGAISAYLVRYEGIPKENILNGLYFLAVLVLFLGIAETLAKDMRDLENDGASGKRTTSVFIGNRYAAAASLVFSMAGISLWAYPYFFISDTFVLIRGLILFIFVSWTLVSIFLCVSLYRKYTKSRARELHVSYLLTLTSILAITFVAGVA